MSHEPDDATVITASIQRPQEFTVIFERHFDEIHRYLRRRHPSEAEELAADVFTVAFDARARYRPQGDSARPWLYGIASRLLARRWRSETRGLRAHARSAGSREPERDDFTDAVERADAQQRSAAVAAAVAGLNQGERDVLLLFALAELSYEEIAMALEIPIGTVRSRLARARRRCRAQLTGVLTEEASRP